MGTRFNRIMERCTYHKPILEGFEKVLGRKIVFKDFDHFTKYDYPILSDKTKAEIKLKDQEIEHTKIDTHPRHYLGSLVKNFGGEWEFTNIEFSFELTDFIPCHQIKLEIFL